MPRGDATGPMGMGRMTGRAAGFCAGYNVPGCENGRFPGGMGRAFGGGRGRGFGPGRGMANRFGRGRDGIAYCPTPMTEDNRLDELTRQAEFFERALKDIHARIDSIKTDQAKDDA